MFKYFISLVLLVSVLFLQSCGNSSPAVKKYNVILIAVDTLRADHLGCYGYPYPTSPRLDEFAKKTVFFEYAFCPIPKTSASFASMLTGLHPCIHQTKPNRSILDEKYQTLAEILKANGYHTAAVVDNANLSRFFHFDQGFDSYTEVWNETESKTQSTPFITKKVLSFLNTPPSKPFFLWVNYIEPHGPYIPPQSFIQERPQGRDLRTVKKRILSVRIKREMIKNNNFYEGYVIARYDGAVSYIDSEVGKIIDTFFKKGLNKNTIFIFAADHGEDLGERNFFFEHGPLTFSHSVRVPLMMYIPGSSSATVKTPVSVMDIYPTLLEQMRIRPPYPLQGVSLLTPQKDRLLYIFGIKSHAVVKNNIHYINVSPRFQKRLGLPPNHLYDIFLDPQEKQNLYSGKINLALILSAQYDDYLKKHPYLRSRRENPGKRKLSEKEKKSLKTLGYL